ncbi:hypothetical protein JCM11641_006915 [Rhodosporidiobolus odoratus]
MPPRRSSRVASPLKATATTSSNVLSLLDSSPEPPKKRTRASSSKSKGKGKARQRASSSDVEFVGDEEERVKVGKTSDEAFARMLQDEEHASSEVNQPAVACTLTSSPRRSTRRSSASDSTSAQTRPADSGATAQPTDTDDPQRVVRLYGELLRGDGDCKCGGAMEKAEGITLTPSLTLSDLLAFGSATCKSCSKLICRGCGSPLPNEDSSGSGECCAESRVVLLCVLDKVYLTDHLAKPAPATNSSKGKKPASPKKKKPAPSTSGAGTGYGTGPSAYSAYAYPYTANGTGYGYGDSDEYDSEEMDMDAWEDEMGEMDMDEQEEKGYEGFEAWREERRKEREKNKPKPAAIVENTHDTAQDKLYFTALTLLRLLLPTPDSPTAKIYDYLPHPSLPSLLSLSTLPDLLALLLRNDSAPEWARRSELYFAMLGVLEGLTGCEGTLGSVFGERREKRWSEGLRAVVEGRGEVRWVREMVAREKVQEEVGRKKKGRGRKRKSRAAEEAEEEEMELAEEGEVVMALPLFTLLRKLATQATAFHRAAATGALDDLEADAALIGICGDFGAAGERCAGLEKVWVAMQEREGVVSAAMEEEEGKKGKGKEREWSEKDYENACGKLAYETVELGVEAVGEKGGRVFPTHHYKAEIEAISSHRRPHNSFVHLAKELAVLSTSLPPGIWVRVDEARVDVLKVLIAGPADSPYAGGLFEFDMFIPLEYPNKSPSCWLRTTGKGACRFNPNLYAEGKVCLSLLGTWSGSPEEMWQPGKSTILQVLLSITSITNMPFYNEPGFGAPRDDGRNKNYNKNCSLATTRWAILDWIEGDKYKDSLWGDIITSHFLLHRNQLLSTLSTWSSLDPRYRTWTPSMNDTAGTDKLEPFDWKTYYANNAAAGSAGAGVEGGKEGKGKGKAKGSKGKKDEEKEEDEQPKGRDLVKEVNQALETLQGWRKEGWLEGLVKAA